MIQRAFENLAAQEADYVQVVRPRTLIIGDTA